MLFSIIVPVYNVEKYLRECLESIRLQSYRDFEVIMVDDGSTDSCPLICDEYSRKDDRFKTIHKKNGGLVSARKAGAEIVSGEYILNVDSDDYIDQKLLEELEVEVNSYNPDLLAFCYKSVDENGEIKNMTENAIGSRFYKEDVNVIKQSYMYDKTVHGQNGGCLIFSIWTKLVRRDIYKDCQALVDSCITKGEDTILNLYIIDKAQSVYVSKTAGYNYRQQPASMTHVFNEKDIENQRLLVAELRKIELDKEKYTKQIDMYIFYSTYMMLQKLVNNNTGYSQYRDYVERIIDAKLFNDIHSDLKENVRAAEKIKVLLIKKKLWFILYAYFRMSNLVRWK